MFDSKIDITSYLLAVLLMLFLACSKEEDNQLPSVSIISPENNELFQAGDTVNILANISDDKGLRQVVVDLKNENNIAVLSQRKDVQGTRIDFSMDFKLTDASLSGRYYFDVRAYDESDYSSAFRYVNVGATSEDFLALFVYSASSNKTDVHRYFDGEWTFLRSNSGDFLESLVDVQNRQIISCGYYDGDLIAIDTAGNEEWKESSAKVPQLPHFNDVYFEAGTSFVALHEGRLLGIDYRGIDIFENVLDPEFVPKKYFKHEDRSLYQKERKTNGQRFLSHVYFPSGQVVSEIIFPHGEIVHFHSLSSNRVLIFCNDVSTQRIFEYNTQNLNLNEVYTSQDQEFRNFARIDEDRIAISRGNRIDIYQASQRQMQNFKSGIEVEVLRFVSSENSLWSSHENTIQVFDVANANLVEQISAPVNATSFEVMTAY